MPCGFSSAVTLTKELCFNTVRILIIEIYENLSVFALKLLIAMCGRSPFIFGFLTAACQNASFYLNDRSCTKMNVVISVQQQRALFLPFWQLKRKHVVAECLQLVSPVDILRSH